MKTVEFVDQTLRDGQQSWWGMRLRLGMALPIAELTDRIGYHTVDLTGSSLFEVLVRYCREDPWEFLRAMKEAMPRSRLRAGTRSNGIVTFGLTADEVMELWVRRLCANGIGSFWIYDCLYNIEKMGRLVKAVRSEGADAIVTIPYAESPAHTDEYYAARATELAGLGPDGLLLIDPAGILPPERTRTLIPAIQKAIGELPLELNFHTNGTYAQWSYLEGIALGAQRLHTASRPVANGPAVPSIEMMLVNLRATGADADLDEKHLPAIAAHLEAVAASEGWPVGQPFEYDARVHQHQLPGGMMGTLRNQLKERGIEHQLDAVLGEIAMIRRELGYPPMATPFSQIAGTQAVLNLTAKERYAMVTDEIVMYCAGHYGPSVAPMDQDVVDRVMSTPRARELAGTEPPQPTLRELRASFGETLSDDELLLRLLISDDAIAAMRAAGPPRRDYPLPPSPEARLLRRILQHPAGRYLHVDTPEFTVTLRRDG